jgi:hypothetical protein
MCSSHRYLYLLLALLGLISSSASAHMSAAQIDWKPQTLFMSYNQPSKAAADRVALEGCRKLAKNIKQKLGACKIVHRSRGVGWAAVVCASKKNDCAIVSGYEDEPGAIEAARQTCAGAYSGDCTEGVTTVFDNVFNADINRAASHDNNCSPPSGHVLHYEDFCQNGDCIRHFENGCERRFQAPYCFNPMKNKFEFMPDGCP